MPIQLISYLQDTGFDLYSMREWLSGGAPPCQGGGRGFDPRLALEKRTIPNWYRSFFSSVGLGSKVRCLRSAPYRSFISYAHDRGTRLYWAVPYRWGGGRGGFSVQVR